MHEHGQDGKNPLGAPRGEPERPLVELSLVFLAFYLASYLFSRSSPQAISAPGYHLAVIAVNVPRAAFLLYLIAVGDGFGPFGLRRPRLKDALRGLACSLGAAGVILVPGLLFSAFGIENAFLAQAKSGPRASAALIPLFLATAMTTGYCEELFFRSYLLRRLGQAGLRPIWAAIASALLFGLGHGYQGLVGLVSGSLLGLYFAWRWYDSKNLHEIAIGHGLFDAAVFAIALYS